jgi:hypothetical protein
MDARLNENNSTLVEHHDRTRFGDFSELLQTAWPLMLSTGLFSITLFIDRLFLYLPPGWNLRLYKHLRFAIPWDQAAG